MGEDPEMFHNATGQCTEPCTAGFFLTSREELLCMVELAKDLSLMKLQLNGTKRKALYSEKCGTW